MPPVQCLITIYVNYALPSCCKTLYMWIMQCYLVAKALYMWIMQCHAVELIIMYVNYIMLWFFCIKCSICRQRLYIQLLFLCISHLKRWWKYLEWKQGIQSRQCYLLKQTSCWLQRAPQRRIQRLMTSPISPLRSMLKLGRVILPMSCMLSCIA